jgi:hypothetical protein
VTEELAYSAPAERNKDPILEVLMAAFSQACLPVGDVLEIASGYGQHVVHFAAALPALTWHPSDPDLASRQVMAQRLARCGLPNIQHPIDLDVMDTWPSMSVDAIIVANMLHISPPDTLRALCAGAKSVCRRRGLLHIYGPFKQRGEHTSPSNEAFDLSLQQRDPNWGIRDLEEVISVAASCGWRLTSQTDMPANNLSLLFQAQ